MAPYRGRFAPTPSGPLHWGSLLTALVSYLDAKANGGQWFLRIDDLDTARVRPGATDAIMRCLEAHGLGWDGPVTYQSGDPERYQSALRQLHQSGWLYACTCSRKAVAGQRYPGTCSTRQHPEDGAALRIRCPPAAVRFADYFAGPQQVDLTAAFGDFIVKRRDNVVAYQLAAAVDDAAPGITRVVRGGDLLDSTPRQLHVLSALGLAKPEYGHLPILIDDKGVKLSKQLGSAPIVESQAADNLQVLLRWLDLLTPDSRSSSASVVELLNTAIHRWRERVTASGHAPTAFQTLQVPLANLLLDTRKR